MCEQGGHLLGAGYVLPPNSYKQVVLKMIEVVFLSTILATALFSVCTFAIFMKSLTGLMNDNLKAVIPDSISVFLALCAAACPAFVLCCIGQGIRAVWFGGFLLLLNVLICALVGMLRRKSGALCKVLVGGYIVGGNIYVALRYLPALRAFLG